ncbi:MAG: redoxin domain-containing protein [Alphaproteobacteria bacterium]|nr:redoxin domain-containing protein [Alphaproteobacteria bacterium]
MPDPFVLAARLTLVAVFVTAGVAKLADPAGARKAILEFGLPAALAPSLAITVPLVELATAALLLPATTAWWGALAALALLLAFGAGIVANLAQGRKPDCHCFGQLHSEPVNWRTLARDGALMALAAFLVWEGPEHVGPSAVAWLGDPASWQTTGLILMAVFIAAQAWFLIELFRQQGRLLLRIDALQESLVRRGFTAPTPQTEAKAFQGGLSVGAQAPTFSLPDLAGERVALEHLRAAGHPLLLVFTDPGCGPCIALAPDLVSWHTLYQGKLALATVSRGTAEQNRAKFGPAAALPVLLQADREVAAAYLAHGTPAAVIIQSDGTIGSGLAMGAEAIRNLVEQTVQPLPASSARRSAAPVPTAQRPGALAPLLARMGQT